MRDRESIETELAILKKAQKHIYGSFNTKSCPSCSGEDMANLKRINGLIIALEWVLNPARAPYSYSEGFAHLQVPTCLRAVVGAVDRRKSERRVG